MKRLFDILARMRRLSLTLLLIPSALYLSAEEPTHPFTINASGAQVLLEPGSLMYTWNELAASSWGLEGFLTKAEWEYLLAHHEWRFLSRAGSLPSNYGIVIYPQDYEGTIIGDKSDYQGESISEGDWATMESAGARFLYYRMSGNVTEYWTATETGDNAYCVLFSFATSPTPGTVTCEQTAAKTVTKYAIRVTRLPAPSCDCFTVHF